MSGTAEQRNDTKEKRKKKTYDIEIAAFLSSNPLLSAHKDFLGRRWGVSQRCELDTILVLAIISALSQEGRKES